MLHSFNLIVSVKLSNGRDLKLHTFHKCIHDKPMMNAVKYGEVQLEFVLFVLYRYLTDFPNGARTLFDLLRSNRDDLEGWNFNSGLRHKNHFSAKNS